MKPVADWDKEDGSYELSFLSLFSLTCSGVFNPLCAFQGGVVAQEVVKAITQKFSPINKLFYYDAYEVLPLSTFKPLAHLASSDALSKFAADLYREVKHRSDGLRIILGNEMIEKLA
jgi:molybdopterin/thiamine biosynthesis adenylyltransferase